MAADAGSTSKPKRPAKASLRQPARAKLRRPACLTICFLVAICIGLPNAVSYLQGLLQRRPAMAHMAAPAALGKDVAGTEAALNGTAGRETAIEQGGGLDSKDSAVRMEKREDRSPQAGGGGSREEKEQNEGTRAPAGESISSRNHATGEGTPILYAQKPDHFGATDANDGGTFQGKSAEVEVEKHGTPTARAGGRSSVTPVRVTDRHLGSTEGAVDDASGQRRREGSKRPAGEVPRAVDKPHRRVEEGQGERPRIRISRSGTSRPWSGATDETGKRREGAGVPPPGGGVHKPRLLHNKLPKAQIESSKVIGTGAVSAEEATTLRLVSGEAALATGLGGGVSSPSPLRVYMYDLPAKFNWELLAPEGGGPPKGTVVVTGPGVFDSDKLPQVAERGWGRLSADRANQSLLLPAICSDPLDAQYFPDYFLVLSLLSGGLASVRRVRLPSEADVFFVPFFATLSFVRLRGHSTHRRDKDEDLQDELVDWLSRQDTWQQHRGRRHFISAFHPHAMEHALPRLRAATFLVADFWRPSAAAREATALEKDLVGGYNSLLKRFDNDTGGWGARPTLLFFRGGTKRKRRGVLREQLVSVLEGEEGVRYEEGAPWEKGAVALAAQGMQTSKYCLVPAGDCPSTSRLYDTIASHCVPVVVSDFVELPYEDVLDYTDFAIFVKERKALAKGYLTTLLRAITKERWNAMWRRLLEVDKHFLYGFPPKPDGAEDMLWRALQRRVEAKGPLKLPKRTHRKSFQA